MPNKFLPPQTDTATRTASTPIQGEIFYDTDENQLYYGDGATTGGVVVGSAGAFADLSDVDTTGLQTGEIMVWNGAVWVPGSSSSGREVLTANRTYYVRTDGSDSNDGLTDSAGGAFLTIQKAVDAISSLDTSIYQATISIQEGETFAENIFLYPTVGTLPPIIQGGVTRPILTCSSGTVITSTVFSNWKVKDIKLENTTGANDLILVNPNATLTFPNNSNVEFGVTQRFSILNLGFLNMDENEGGTTLFVSSGSVATFGGFLRSFGGTAFTAAARGTWTITNTPAFGDGTGGGFIHINQGAVADFINSTFTGSATGRRYDVSLNAAVRVTGASATFFPGNAAGVTATGGQYA